MKSILNLLLIVIILGLPIPINAQATFSEDELHNFLNNKKILITYREGEVLYGTYYYIEIHYCPNGYGLYGSTVKQTVLGNEQRSNWQEFGKWKTITQKGLVGIHYITNTGKQNFVPVYNYNGRIFIKEGVTVLQKGKAICY